MLVTVTATLAVAWMDYTLDNYAYWTGDTAYLCEVVLREPGPKDSMIHAWCEYEPWMERWIMPGEVAEIVSVSTNTRHPVRCPRPRPAL